MNETMKPAPAFLRSPEVLDCENWYSLGPILRGGFPYQDRQIGYLNWSKTIAKAVRAEIAFRADATGTKVVL